MAVCVCVCIHVYVYSRDVCAIYKKKKKKTDYIYILFRSPHKVLRCVYLKVVEKLFENVLNVSADTRNGELVRNRPRTRVHIVCITSGNKSMTENNTMFERCSHTWRLRSQYRTNDFINRLYPNQKEDY